jgi:hypothetical protein
VGGLGGGGDGGGWGGVGGGGVTFSAKCDNHSETKRPPEK